MRIYAYGKTSRTYRPPSRPTAIDPVQLRGVARSGSLRDPAVRPAPGGGGLTQHAVLDPRAAQGTRTDHDQRPGARPSDGPYDARTKHPAAAAKTPDRSEAGRKRRPAKGAAFDDGGAGTPRGRLRWMGQSTGPIRRHAGQGAGLAVARPVARRRRHGFPRRTRRTSVTNTLVSDGQDRRFQAPIAGIHLLEVAFIAGAAERDPPRRPGRTERADRFRHGKNPAARVAVQRGSLSRRTGRSPRGAPLASGMEVRRSKIH